MHHTHWNQEHNVEMPEMVDSEPAPTDIEKEVMVVPAEEHYRLDEEHIPHKRALMSEGLLPIKTPKEVKHMHTTELEVELGNNCGYGHGNFGGALAGGLIGGALSNGGFGRGNWGGYGMPYGYGAGFNGGVSVGDMYGAAETNKVGHTVARDIFAADRNQTQQGLMTGFAIAQKIDGSDLRNTVAHAALAKDICDVKTTLNTEILESRHLNAMEHCATRELTLKETGAILAKMACDREQELRDALLLERCHREKAEATVVNAQIINQLGTLNTAIAGLLSSQA